MVEAAFRRVSGAGVTISGILLFAMMVRVSFDVALKYAIDRPVPGTLEVVSAYYMVGACSCRSPRSS
jgi:hypothetical protein